MNHAPRDILPSVQAANPARTASAGLECIALSKTFPGATVPVLKGVSLTVHSNEFFTLLGPSGCGKTTLLRLVAGLETQDQGAIRVAGEVLDGLPPYRRPVNTVFQSYAIFPHLTVAENIAYGLRARRRPNAEIAAKVEEMLALVRLDGLGSRRPRQLSGGQQQRVALARALANQPRVLLLDEPLSALDLKLRSEMQLELKRIQSELGITFIFVTHDQHEALTMSDRIAVMRDGEILQIGTPPDIYERPANRFVAEFIGETNLIEVTGLGGMRYRLPSGAEIEGGSASPAGATTTLAIRPEHAVITEAAAAAIKGVVTNIVYLGADRMYYLMLEGGIPFRIRQTNNGSSRGAAVKGETVGVAIAEHSVRVLP